MTPDFRLTVLRRIPVSASIRRIPPPPDGGSGMADFASQAMA